MNGVLPVPGVLTTVEAQLRQHRRALLRAQGHVFVPRRVERDPKVEWARWLEEWERRDDPNR
jgi:hypothetical protein